jgi:signal transduction histidine kinase
MQNILIRLRGKKNLSSLTLVPMLRPTLFKKFLFPSLLLALVPLFAVSVLLYTGLEHVRDHLAQEVARTADQMASETLQNRARQVAESITSFLRERENDLRFLSRFAYDRRMLLDFYRVHNREIVDIRNGKERRRQIPLYRSIALIDANGQELLVVRDGRTVPAAALKNVAHPEKTEFKSETYFHAIRSMAPGYIHVSKVTGWHISMQEQLAGKQFEGVIRFGTPLFNQDGQFEGALVISLDHRHLMEFSQHIDPGPGYFFAEPSYESTNYAFLFDDEGWIITHPKYWDIRGLDHRGRPVPAYSEHASRADIDSGRIPFNLDHAGFIHPNYPKVAEALRKHHTGTVETTNVGKSRKIMAYAPILYNSGTYSKHGIFGGVTIGLQMDQYYQQSSYGSQLISSQLRAFRYRSIWIMLLTALLAGLAAWRLARGIMKPIQKLNLEAHRLAAGDAALPIIISGSDELAQLTETFNYMAGELEQRKASLIATLDQLQESRQAILDERNFKESILESISSAIITFSPDGLLTSRNSTADRFLGIIWPLGSHYSMVFEGWEPLPTRIATVFAQGTGYGREPLKIEQDGRVRHFDIGIFPIGSGAERRLTVTLREETVREELREETIRLERLASLGKLAAGISHEIRNPLTGISLLLDDLHDRAQLGDKDREMLTKAMAEIERMERLISALLTFAAPPRSRFAPGDPGDAAEDVAMLMQRSCQRQGINLRLERKPLPTCLIDAEKIRQALLNLLKNALEALPTGGLITITVSRDGDDALITFTDSGPGIPANDLPLIFEPFFTRKGAGTGLGLSITRQIIEEHGGSINIDSEPGKGATFLIRLPLSRPNGPVIAKN